MSAAAWRGPEALRALLVPLRSIQADPKNARRHPKRNLDAIRASIREFGQRKPVVVRAATVIAGSGTLQAMDLEGFEEIAVVQADDLTEEQARAYALADNQTGDLAEWDPEALAEALGPLPEPLKGVTGFDADEIRSIAALAFDKSKDGPDQQAESEFATIKVTRDQYTIIKGACARVQQREGTDITEGRALELLCAEYLSGR